ncbi:predicted protein [Naegleria gruberi]|uniref:Predicted protein n=1 Tax=Naegleria gruberi TaxID=5762 RepID=D2VHS5_NAEGR|nr:uncharacterized protein NAEGRDRAFT_49645 [Naegleria gruberi]EFC43645.1 predicted protein [Naegleria gruberi]|eukprot:XP_002676389.1 predicted protein [Naegleria gruberi strain NEG-M]
MLATPSTPPQQQQQANTTTTTTTTTSSSTSAVSGGEDQLLKFFASKLSSLNVPTSLEASSSEDKANNPINKIVFADLEKEFSDIVGKLLSNEDVCKKVDLFLLDLFTSEKSTQSTNSDYELYENYIRVAYYLYLLSSRESTKNNFDLILLQHVPICLYVYFQTKNNSKLDETQQLFLSKIESVLLLIYNNEGVKRRETPDNEKTLTFIASQINGIKTRYNNTEKINATITPSKSDPTLSTSLLLGSSHANEDFYTGISSKTLYVRSELMKNQESLYPLFFRDHESSLPLATEINDKVLGVVCQTFSKRLDVLSLGSIFTFMRVVQKLVSQKVPYRIPTMEQVEIIRTRNEQAKKIMEESLKVIREDTTHESQSAGTSEFTSSISETEIQLDIETPTPKKDKKKKMYYHEYLTQLDLITMYSEHYGDVESNESTNEPVNARRIPLSESFINETLAVLKHTSQSLDKLSQQYAPQDLFGSKQTSSKAVIVEVLYAVYLRLIYDFVDSRSLLQVQSMLKMLD